MGKPPALSAYLTKARQEIETWENGKQGYLATLGDFVLNPAAKLTEKTIPKPVQNAASKVIEQTLRLMARAGEFSVDVKGADRKVKKRLKGKRAFGQQFTVRDELAKNLWASHCA